jgi:hypothetical protein
MAPRAGLDEQAVVQAAFGFRLPFGVDASFSMLLTTFIQGIAPGQRA